MYIQSKFHDYYDSVISITGIDKKNTFVREQKIINLKTLSKNNQELLNINHYERSYSPNNRYGYRKSNFSFSSVPIDLYLCNKRYTGYCFMGADIPISLTDKYKSRIINIDYYYTSYDKKLDGVKKGILLFDPLEIQDFINTASSGIKDTILKDFKLTPTIVEDSVFEELQVPVFLVSDHNIINNSFFKTIHKEEKDAYSLSHSGVSRSYRRENKVILSNPILADLGIPKFIDSFEIYQEIAMFIARINTHEVIVEMTDDIIRDSKGFDNRSFKKEPTKNKNK